MNLLVGIKIHVRQRQLLQPRQRHHAAGNQKANSNSTSFRLSILRTRPEAARVSSGTVSQFAGVELKLNQKEQRFGRNHSVRLIGVLRCVSHDLPLENSSSQLSTSRRCLTWIPRYGFDTRRQWKRTKYTLLGRRAPKSMVWNM
jgi:hypothetical protein